MFKWTRLKLHWSIWLSIVMMTGLFSAYQINVKAMGGLVFVGRISAQIPMATCTNVYTCSACSLCGCGAWDQDIIAPVFGMNTNSTFYACKMSSFQPKGTGGMMVGSIVFGNCGQNQLSVWNPLTCNIWSQYQ